MKNIRLALSLLFVLALAAPNALNAVNPDDEFSMTIGTDELKNVDLFPNPVKTFLNFDLNDFNEDDPATYTITVYNSLGRMMVTDKFSVRSFKIDFTSFNAGFYFVEIVCGENKITRRIQKDK